MPEYVNNAIWYFGIISLLVCCAVGIGACAIILRRIQMTLARLRMIQKQEWGRFQEATALMRLVQEESMKRRVADMRAAAARAVENR